MGVSRSRWRHRVGLASMCVCIVIASPFAEGPPPAAAASPTFLEPWWCGVIYDITSYSGAGHEGDKAIDINNLSTAATPAINAIGTGPQSARSNQVAGR